VCVVLKDMSRGEKLAHGCCVVALEAGWEEMLVRIKSMLANKCEIRLRYLSDYWD
jgi:hypothetical protein